MYFLLFFFLIVIKFVRRNNLLINIESLFVLFFFFWILFRGFRGLIVFCCCCWIGGFLVCDDIDKLSLLFLLRWLYISVMCFFSLLVFGGIFMVEILIINKYKGYWLLLNIKCYYKCFFDVLKLLDLVLRCFCGVLVEIDKVILLKWNLYWDFC